MLMNRRARLEAVAIQCDRFIQIREICLLWWSLWTIDVARFTAIFFHFARFCNAFDWRRRQLVWFSISLTHYSVMIFVCASQTRFAYILRLHFIRFESLSRLVLVRTVAANINWLVVGFFCSVVISFCLLGFANIFVWFSANWFLFTSFCCHKFDGKLTEKTECSWKVSVWKFSIDVCFVSWCRMNERDILNSFLCLNSKWTLFTFNFWEIIKNLIKHSWEINTMPWKAIAFFATFRQFLKVSRI